MRSLHGPSLGIVFVGYPWQSRETRITNSVALSSWKSPCPELAIHRSQSPRRDDVLFTQMSKRVDALQTQLAEAQKQLQDEFKDRGDPFKIK